MDQAEKIIDDLCLINHGSVFLSGDLQENKKKYSRNSVILEYSGNSSFIDELPVVESSNDYGNYMEITLKKESNPSELFKLIANSELEIRKFEASETTLNQIFIDIAGKSASAKNT
jgi:ABC-2 type transport system ATP-binding protein